MPTNTNNTEAVCHGSGLFKSVKSQIARLTISILLEPPQGKCFFFINLFAGSSPKKNKKKRELHDSSSSKFPVAPFWFATVHSALRMVVKVLGSNLRDCHGANKKTFVVPAVIESHASHASQMHHRFPCVTWTTSFRRIEHLASHNRSVLNH